MGFGSLLYTSLLMYGKDLYTPRDHMRRRLAAVVHICRVRLSVVRVSFHVFVIFAIFDRLRKSLICVSFDVCMSYMRFF